MSRGAGGERRDSENDGQAVGPEVAGVEVVTLSATSSAMLRRMGSASRGLPERDAADAAERTWPGDSRNRSGRVLNGPAATSRRGGSTPRPGRRGERMSWQLRGRLRGSLRKRGCVPKNDRGGLGVVERVVAAEVVADTEPVGGGCLPAAVSRMACVRETANIPAIRRRRRPRTSRSATTLSLPELSPPVPSRWTARRRSEQAQCDGEADADDGEVVEGQRLRARPRSFASLTTRFKRFYQRSASPSSPRSSGHAGQEPPVARDFTRSRPGVHNR
jgi:hypothetical protein